MHNKLTFLWFFIGLGMKLQILASLSITESVIFVSAPFIIIREYRYMRRSGAVPLFILSLFLNIGCVIACVVNNTPSAFAMRGLAVTTLFSCSIIFGHCILRKDPAGFKWMFVGIAFSLVVSTFVFQSSVELSMYGSGVADIMNGPLFWIQRLGAFIMIPTKGWYVHMPTFVNIGAPMFMAIFSIMSSSSGRAVAVTTLLFVMLVLLGGRKQSSMRRLSKHFISICIVGIIMCSTLYIAYKVSVSKGLLGEAALAKYEIQTRGESGVLRLLLGGRADAFIGLLACRDKPITGWGPWAMDYGAMYRDEFMSKYGTVEDYEELQKLRAGGYLDKNILISAHSHITEFWLFYGIAGLVFILYVIFVLVRFLKDDAAVVPQWYGWLVCGIPSLMWHIFFSPFAERVTTALLLVACLMARAVRLGRFALPYEMMREIDELERKR